MCAFGAFEMSQAEQFEPFEVCQSAVEESMTTGNYSVQGVTKPGMSQGFW